MDFFDAEAMAGKVCNVLRFPDEYGFIRGAAKSTASSFDVKQGVRGYFDILEDVISDFK